MSCHDDTGALEDLAFHWGSAYVVSHPAADIWLAERRDDHRTLVAPLPGELLDKIRSDYLACPVSKPLDRPGLNGGARSGRGVGFPYAG